MLTASWDPGCVLALAGGLIGLYYLLEIRLFSGTLVRSWYSWVVKSLVNGVYAFGFLFMLPQLFVNYKAFNTFIDDVFAFIISMPTAHRLACFRDDIVFVLYLYQKWLYPVDKSRVNEYGMSFEPDDNTTVNTADEDSKEHKD